MRALLLLAAVWLMSEPAPALAQISEDEAALVARVDAILPQARELLEQTVNINSGTMNFEGVRSVGRLLADEFEQLGLETQWVEGKAWNRAGHLIARSGDSGLHFLLIGHLDTVFEADSPFQKYASVDENAASGPGTTDMKGGNVIMVMALRALRDVGLLARCRITVVLTGDEEKAGRPLTESRSHLVEAARSADVAIGFEDGDGDAKTAVVARRGASGWRLDVAGRPAHSSQIFREDYDLQSGCDCWWNAG